MAVTSIEIIQTVRDLILKSQSNVVQHTGQGDISITGKTICPSMVMGRESDAKYIINPNNKRTYEQIKTDWTITFRIKYSEEIETSGLETAICDPILLKEPDSSDSRIRHIILLNNIKIIHPEQKGAAGGTLVIATFKVKLPPRK